MVGKILKNRNAHGKILRYMRPLVGREFEDRQESSK